MDTSTLVAIMALLFSWVVGFLVGFTVAAAEGKRHMAEIRKLLIENLPVSVSEMRTELKKMMNPADAKMWIGNPDETGVMAEVTRMTKQRWNEFVDNLDDADTINFYAQYIKHMEENVSGKSAENQ